MVTIEEIKSYVSDKKFGVTEYRLPDLYFSNGLMYAYEEDPEAWTPFIAGAIKKLGTDDYGDFYDDDEKPVPGFEYYTCPSPFGSDRETGIIIHREYGEVILFFTFE